MNGLPPPTYDAPQKSRTTSVTKWISLSCGAYTTGYSQIIKPDKKKKKKSVHVSMLSSTSLTLRNINRAPPSSTVVGPTTITYWRLPSITGMPWSDTGNKVLEYWWLVRRMVVAHWHPEVGSEMLISAPLASASISYGRWGPVFLPVNRVS